MEVTRDAFLNGKLHISQPTDGYRAATDPVYLAASIPAKSGQAILDVGCGVGTASLCLNARISGLNLTGIEVQSDYAKLAQENASANNATLDVVVADLQNLPDPMRQRSFDHVITNPPFFDGQTMSPPESQAKAVAHVETLDLQSWISLSLKRLAPKGSFSIIHLTERLPDILTGMNQSCGDIRILPITARRGRAAKRVLVQGIKTSRAPTQLLSPLVVHDGEKHEADGDDYSQDAKDILRQGRALVL